MKIKYFLTKLFILLLFTNLLNAQNVFVPDDNFEQALINLGYDSGALNDSVQLSMIINLTSLNVSYKEIKDLSGIEYFEKLVTLYCNNNLLTNLDLTQNFSVKNLVCHNNLLTEIKLGLKLDLNTLSCNNNKLEHLDLRGALNLQRLDCFANSLSELDLSVNKKLTYLDVSNNQLTSLNIKNENNSILGNLNIMSNENLYCVEVDDPVQALSKYSWYRSGFTSYSDNCNTFTDKMTFVPDDNFEQALISMGVDYTGLNDSVPTEAIKYLKDLVIDNKNIKDLTGIEDFISLNYLDCNQNELQTINLSLNPKLRFLRCDFNQIKNLDLSQNSELTFFEATNNQLVNLNLQNGNNNNMYVSIFNNPDLTCIQVDDPDTAYKTLNWNKSLCTGYSEDCSTFKLQMTYIPDDKFEQTLINRGIDCYVLNDSVPTFAIDQIEMLDISGQEITDLTGIEDFKSLRELNCQSNYLTSLNLHNNSKLESLYSGYNNLTELKLPFENLKLLDCTYNDLDTLNLLQLNNLEKLYCSNNKLKIINLTGNKSLTTLFCENNEIENIDLSANTNLEMLIIRGNQLTSLDISVNARLTNLDCQSNSLNQLNLKNGNIENLGIVDASFNPDLYCIEVDDPAIAYEKNVWYKNNYAIYTEDCSNLNREMTYVPDNVFEENLISLGYDIGTPDDSVATAVLQQITIINLSNSGIKDLTGIEAFTNLQTFICEGNYLTSLDFSSNKKLKTLQCAYNQLTSLIINSNTNLEYLSCYKNKLSELDISSNLSLFLFHCGYNNLSKLDLKAHQNLLELSCTNNKLKYLDLSATDSLVFVDCSDNLLETLNLKNGHNDRLNSLYCTNNQLTCIQVDDPNSIPYYFDWRKDEIASYSSDCDIPPLKVNEISNIIDIYPNPAQSKVFVDTGNKQVKLKIFNSAGSIIFSKNTFVSSWIEIEKYDPGVYIFRITGENSGPVINKKVVVEKQK
jgi:Leucine-rich repeat (LRR) protein